MSTCPPDGDGLHVIEWDKASEDGLPKVSISFVGKPMTISRFIKTTEKVSGVAMIKCIKVPNNDETLLNIQNYDDPWDTIQDAFKDPL